MPSLYGVSCSCMKSRTRSRAKVDAATGRPLSAHIVASFPFSLRWSEARAAREDALSRALRAAASGLVSERR